MGNAPAARQTSPFTNLAQRARPTLKRGLRAAEGPITAAFVALVKHQAHEGRIAPRVERGITDALRQVQMTEAGKARTDSPAVRQIISQFHRLYYNDRQTWRRNKWRGQTTWKCPLDLWLYQEIIYSVKPGLIIETGTAFGGSATFMGWLLDVDERGQVVSVDVAPRATPEHPRVTYLTGSSTDPVIVEKVKSLIPPGEPVMVILDSDHSERHVYDELQAYADVVTVGSYLIVEDSNVNGHPVNLEHGPGPMEATKRFLAQRKDFAVDSSMHRMHLTFNPRGFLRRIQ